MRHVIFTFAALLAAVLGCDSQTTTPSDASDSQSFRSGARDWCDVYTCEPCPSTGCPPGGEAVTYCCPETGGCNASHEVPAGSTCPSGKFLVICNWGMTNEDGSFTCFDTP